MSSPNLVYFVSLPSELEWVGIEKPVNDERRRQKFAISSITQPRMSVTFGKWVRYLLVRGGRKVIEMNLPWNPKWELDPKFSILLNFSSTFSSLNAK